MANLICKYNVTTTEPITICNTTDSFSDILYNGVSIGLVTEYQFSSLNEHTLEFILEDKTSIGDYAFYGCTGLTSIVIPDSVTTIGDYAFYGCRNLTSVTIGSGVTSIGSYAFAYCTGLKDIVIPNSVTSIGNNAFYGCTGLKDIVIPNSVTSIGNNAFYDCNGLTSVVISNSVTSIGKNTFYGCTGLKDIVIPDSITSIGSGAFGNCDSLTSVVIPDSVTSIGSSAFGGCNGLTSVAIPNSVTTIGNFAFYGCSGLKDIAIPDSVTQIGEQVFAYCENLTSIVIPDSVTSIGNKAFGNCYSLNSITCYATTAPTITISTFQEVARGGTLYYPAGADYSFWLSTEPHYLGYYGWNGVEIEPEPEAEPVICKYNAISTTDSVSICYTTESFSDILYNGVSIGVSTEYTFPSTGEHTLEFILGDKTTIDDYAFYKCSGLTSIVIPDSVTSISEYAFYYCTGLTSIVIPDSVTTISDSVFSGCKSLTSVTIGSGVTTMGKHTFYGCSGVTSIVIPDSVTSIGDYAFNYCEILTSVTIGSGVTSIGDYAFSDSASLSKITCYATTATTAPTIANKTFRYIKRGGTLYYPVGYDYSTWLSTEPHYLGYYGWNGVEIEPEEEPDVPDSPSIKLEFTNLTAPTGGITTTLDIETNGVDEIEIIAPEWVEVTDKGGYYEIEVLPNEGTDREGEVIFIGKSNNTNKVQQSLIITQKGNEEMATSIALYKTRLDYTADGGSKYLQVDYVNAQTINAPYCSQSWVTIEQTQSGNTTTNGQPTTQVQYRITMQPSSFARQTNITFSCTDSKGNTVSQNKFMVYQTAPAAAVPTISYNKEGISFDSTGYAEDFSVEVVYENATTILEPVVNGDWITVTEGLPVQGGGSSSENIIVKRYLIEVTATDAYRQGTVIFNASNDIGTANPFIFSVTQLAPVEEEEIVPVVSAYTKTATVKYDGSSTGIAITSLGCSYKNVSSVLTPVISGSWIHLSEGVLQSSSSEDTVVYRYPITFDANDSVERVGYVKFIGTDENGNEYSDSTKITQQAAPVTPDVPEPELPEDSKEVTYSPIWKDVEYVFVSDSEYGIYYDRIHYFQGQMFRDEILLFKGKAYLPPDDSVVKVCINKICQNYMSENPNIFDGAVGYSHSYNEFKLKDSYGTLLHTYRFVNDWSYKELSLGIKTSPIIPNIADGQKLFFSVFATDEKAVKWGMRYYDGTADYNNTEYVSDDFTTVIVPESRQKYVNTFYFGDKSYTSLPRCECKYVLYYMNPYGGYDWLPITGKVVRKDKVEAFVYTKNYNNTTADFGKNRYLSNITVSYNLNTGWLTQEQSDRMWELLESNTVWLHNLDEDRIYPVMITDTNIEHKQKFGKKKRLSYSINVELSQTRERL